jgi:hypothetical protein
MIDQEIQSGAKTLKDKKKQPKKPAKCREN